MISSLLAVYAICSQADAEYQIRSEYRFLLACDSSKLEAVKSIIKSNDIEKIKLGVKAEKLTIFISSNFVEIYDESLFGIGELTSLRDGLKVVSELKYGDQKVVPISTVWRSLEHAHEYLEESTGLTNQSEGFDTSNVSLQIERRVRVKNSKGEELWLPLPNNPARQGDGSTMFPPKPKSGNSPEKPNERVEKVLVLAVREMPDDSTGSLEWKAQFIQKMRDLNVALAGEVTALLKALESRNRNDFDSSGLRGKSVNDLSKDERDYVASVLESYVPKPIDTNDWQILDFQLRPVVEFKFSYGPAQQGVYRSLKIPIGDPATSSPASIKP